MSSVDLYVLESPPALHEAAAEWVAEGIRVAVEANGSCRIVLAGGTTPRGLYERLAATPYREVVPWAAVEVFFGDERCVLPDDAQSTYGMAHDALLRHVPVREEAVHRIRGELLPVEAAMEYEAVVREATGEEHPVFDLVLLGIGADGHTAALFPGTPALAEREALAVATCSPTPPAARVSLTLPVLAGGHYVAFLATGAEKADVVLRTLVPLGEDRLPAAIIRWSASDLTYFLDEAAAAHLDRD